MPRKTGLALLLAVLTCSPVLGQSWALKMFETTQHDFGSIARGAKAEFEFKLNNVYLQDVHIASVRSSCGCTRPRIKEPLLKTYQDSAIVASINTAAFRGHKSATITVTFDQPRPAQVQLHVTSYIRSDVVLEPGSVELGAVDQGTGVDKTIAVTRSGRSDWRILEVKSASPHLSGEVVETARGAGRVSYELSVHLDPNAPPGYLRDHLLLVTNDSQSPQIPVLVEGVVQSSIMVSPASLFMGVVQPGQKVTRQLVVQSKTPFRITSVHCDDNSFQFSTSTADAPKSLHLVPVTFIAGETSGSVLKTIHIETDKGSDPPELSAYAVVSP